MHLRFIKYFGFVLVLLLCNRAFSQKHSWENSFNSKNYTEVNGVDVDSLHNSYAVGIFKDSMVLDNKKIYANDLRNNNDAYLAKFDKNGKLLWYKTIYCRYFSSPNKLKPYVLLGNIKVISNNHILIYGYYAVTSALILSNNDSLSDTRKLPQGNAFLASIDSNGNYIDYFRFAKDYTTVGSHHIAGQIDIDNAGYIYVSTNLFNGSVLYSKKDSIESAISYAPSLYSYICKFSRNWDSLLWYRDFADSGRNNRNGTFFGIDKLRVGKDNNLYVAARLRNSAVINNIRYSIYTKFTKGMLLVLDKDGKYIYTGFINSDTLQGDHFSDLAAIDTNRIYIGGFVQDSVIRSGVCYKSANPSSKGKVFPFIGLISLSQKKDKWIKLCTQKDTIAYQLGYLPGRLNFDNAGNVYYSFQHYGKLLSIGGLTDSNTKAHSAGFAKFDSLGNALWLRSTSQVTDMQSDGQDIVYCGNYKDSLVLKPFTLPYSPVQAGFIAKTFDYTINRGSVKSGPYCAGDTIFVPYTKNGDFDTFNYFIAEISDENGNFEGGERELGRIKTNKDSAVIGKLPSFKVASSSNYRIRIRSTNPVVQSFYKFDVLRLLIYSKDKANPGPPETICMGDSIKLNTYGGTKWTWSPKYRMDDSTKRQPWAWPIKDTIYKIIIADSSGCGKPDTAFKTIKVRAYPKAKLAFADTVICDNSNLKVPVHLEGGDSNYTWRWYFVASPQLWFPSNSGNGKFTDTFSFSPTVSKVAIILKDGCTAKVDTAYLTISQRKPVTITTSYRDTTLCVGNLLNYKATATGGIPKQYRYQWKDLLTNSILSTADSLKILAKKSLKIQLIVNDGCEVLGDTAEFEVMVRAELKALTNLRDTTICDGKSLNYTAQASGGKGSGYNYLWMVDNKLVSTSNILTLNTLYSVLATQILLITKDNCSPNDTIKKTITVLLSPKADFTWDLACSRTITNFTFTGTKPNSPITTSFHWNFNNEASSTLENPSHKFTKSGTSILTLTSNNGCTDTLKKSIIIKPQSKADFTVNDVCENQTALFTNQSQDATSYLWKFGDGQTSNLPTPKHNYQIASTTTYNVTLVAQVLNGCSDSISKALTINKNPSSDFSYAYNGSKVDLKIIKSGNSYQWKFGTTDSAKTTASTYSHAIKSSDQHTVCLTATDVSGCSSQTCKNITVGILKLSEKSFKIFPNPNSGSFTIEMENPEANASIEIYNLIGELVKKVERVEKVTLVDLDVESGIYLVKVKNGSAVGIRKVSVF